MEIDLVLEEAARRYAALQAGMKDAMKSEFYEEYPYSPNDVNAFKAGANWQKEKDKSKVLTEEQCRKIRDDAFELGKDAMKQQMMKDAISAKVTEIYYPTDSCLEIEATLPEGRFKDGDKVLIIKED